MIISHKYKFIFFAVPRTATHSIRQALVPFLSPDDWQQEVLRHQQAFPVAELANLRHGHISMLQVKQYLSEEIWSGYFKFAFVRNPYERFVSVCSFLNKKNASYAIDATNFMKNAFQVERFRERILVRPQTEMLVDEGGNLAMDFIGRYESLQESWEQISEKVGIDCQALQHYNYSKHSHYLDYYDSVLESLVTDFYRDDFEMLGYEICA